MKTAMQMVLDDLIHSINHNGSISYEYLKQKLEKALEAEKHQIIEAYDNGKYITSGKNYGGEQYYTTTYTTNK